MSTSTEKGEWTKDLGGIWFLCLFAGFMMGGVGLFFTIPIAIICTIYAFWAEITGKKGQPTEMTHYQSYGGGSKISTRWTSRIRVILLQRGVQSI